MKYELNKWYPWVAEENSVCPLPFGSRNKVILRTSTTINQSDSSSAAWSWDAKEDGSIVAFMPTYIPPEKEILKVAATAWFVDDKGQHYKTAFVSSPEKSLEVDMIDGVVDWSTIRKKK